MERRKVLFTHGMSNDAMIIITDATVERIEECCKMERTQEFGIGNAVLHLKVTNYVNEIFDSEIHDLEDMEIIGWNEVYDLSSYSVRGEL